MRPMYLPKGAILIIDRLRENGHRADAVGGCVRDFLLDRPCDDYDITTDAAPETVKAILSDLRIIDTGIRHGTVTVLAEGDSFEVTTYRIDGEYLDNRHPESVSFTESLADDLARRDFTVNAMCYNPYDGYTDLYDGRSDLGRRVIRAVGDPTLRFTEDALRIIRAIRFAAVLGFTLDEKTASAAREKRSLLANVSAERIYTELSKLLGGKYAYPVLKDYPDIIETALGFIPEPLPDEHRFAEAEYLTRLLSLFCLAGKSAEDYSITMRRLKTDNRIRTVGESALTLYPSARAETDADLLTLARQAGLEVADEVLQLGILFGRFNAGARERLHRMIADGRAYRISDLAIRGNDLLALGVRGKKIGDTLERLLDLVIAGECVNGREALLTCVRNFLSE